MFQKSEARPLFHMAMLTTYAFCPPSTHSPIQVQLLCVGTDVGHSIEGTLQFLYVHHLSFLPSKHLLTACVWRATFSCMQYSICWLHCHANALASPSDAVESFQMIGLPPLMQAGLPSS